MKVPKFDGRELQGRGLSAWSTLVKATEEKKPDMGLVRKRFYILANQVGSADRAKGYVNATRNDRFIGIVTRATEGR